MFLNLVPRSAVILLFPVLAHATLHHMRHASNIEGYHVSKPTAGYNPVANPLPGMPAVLDPKDIYSAGRPGDLSPEVRRFPSLV
ncbi:MAG: hypothetical protein ABSH09_16530, partial [Bryobacteraceae bacterium]